MSEIILIDSRQQDLVFVTKTWRPKEACLFFKNKIVCAIVFFSYISTFICDSLKLC